MRLVVVFWSFGIVEVILWAEAMESARERRGGQGFKGLVSWAEDIMWELRE